MRNKGIVIWILIFGCFLSPGYGQKQAPVFEAFTDTRELFQDSYVELSLVLRNGEGRGFSAPDFSDFRVISGPSRGISTSIVNGVVRTEMRFAYTLQPRKTGKLQIGSAAITVGTRTLRTRPITLTVRKSGADNTNGNTTQDFFVRAEVNKRDAYIGEQIRLDYTLYTRVDIQSYNMVEESDYLDFYAEDLQFVEGQLERKLIKGKEYYARTLRSLALYPQKAGTLVIGAAALELGVLVGDAGLQSLFFGGEIRRLPASTEPVRIEVKSIPGVAPDSFSGAVGDFNVSFLLNQTEVRADEVLTIQLNITGDGDLKRVEAPVFSAGENFEVYPAKLVEEGYFEEAGRRIGRKLYTYMLVPKAAGTYSLTPTFVYFDPQVNTYKTVSETFKVDVQPGKVPKNGKLANTSGTAIAGSWMGVSELTKSARPLPERPIFWMALILPFLLIGMVFSMQRFQERSSKQAGRKQKEIRQIAIEQLKEAALFRDIGDSRSFFQAISNAVLTYSAKRLGIPLAAQSKDMVLQHLEAKGMNQQRLAEVQALLQRCEMALFAGQHEASDLDRTYQTAVRLLEAIEGVMKTR